MRLAATTLLVTSVMASATVGAQGFTLYDEAQNGDVSDDANNPTSLMLEAGRNDVSGVVVEGDIDYVTVNVPTGLELSALNLMNFVSNTRVSFVGVQQGAVFTEPPNETDVGELLGYVLFGSNELNANILPAIGRGMGAQGFVGPLPAGDYTFWIQEIGSDPTNYTFSFVTTSAAVANEPEVPAEAVFCNGLEVTVDLALGELPTEGDDVIIGTSGDDVINGLGGRDVICGLQGNDTIDGGDGFDVILAGFGDDIVFGGGGNDLLVGSRGIDTISGGNGNDRIRGGDGNDVLHGENGNDLIRGGNGNDTITGGIGADDLHGNLGRDTISGESGNDILRGGAWLDRMDGGDGNDGCTLTDPSGLVEVRINCEKGVFGI